MTAIRFENVSKSFHMLGGRMLLRDKLLHLFKRRGQRFFALRDISFDLGQGESLAIVGHNGAGKSTLLALAAGVTMPDSGHVRVSGNVATLLELGSGFHHDLTGAENIAVNASLMGMKKAEVAARFAAIVDFAGIGEFIDQPLRTYSAGMMVRLAFSIAITVDPDVLLIDEILGAGDEQFFQKCVGRIQGLRQSGKTLLCASHSRELLRLLCDRAVWLDHGAVRMMGATEEVLDAYAEAVGPHGAATPA